MENKDFLNLGWKYVWMDDGSKGKDRYRIGNIFYVKNNDNDFKIFDMDNGEFLFNGVIIDLCHLKDIMIQNNINGTKEV